MLVASYCLDDAQFESPWDSLQIRQQTGRMADSLGNSQDTFVQSYDPKEEL
jgi:hypothetical protein